MELDFVKFVDSVLILRDGSNIQQFNLTAHSDYGDRVNVWIIYALRHNVEAIDVRECSVADLTSHIFISESLKELKVTCNNLHRPGLIFLPALRILHFESVNINGRIDKAFFSAMPSLNTFIVENCSLLKHAPITISARQLETLKIASSIFRMAITIFPGSLKSLDIEVPNEVNLKFKGNFYCLSHAKFDIPLKSFKAISKLISLVKRAESLTLSSRFLSAFVVESQKNISKIDSILSTQHPSLKRVTIESLFDDGEIVFISNLLNKMGKKTSFDTIQREPYEEDQLLSKYKFPNLKFVEIEGFQGSDSEVKMVKFLLENAIHLKRLTIMIAKLDDQSSVNNEEMMKIQRRLSRHPRASSSAGIDFLQTL